MKSAILRSSVCNQRSYRIRICPSHDKPAIYPPGHADEALEDFLEGCPRHCFAPRDAALASLS
eukprot:scaffold225_cov388-Prasinococcus_capsulatus_cf.AAC.24